MKHKLATLFLLLFFATEVLAQEEVTLEQVVAMALEKNYDVKIQKKIAESAATNNKYSVGAFMPRLNAAGSTVATAEHQELKFEDETRNNQGTNEQRTTQANVQLSWVLFDGAGMFATRARMATLADQGELLVKNQMVNTIAQIINSYYDIVRQKQQLKALQEQMAVGEERVKLAERKLQVGTGVKPELLQARVDYNTQRTQAATQEATIERLKEQLNGLVGSQLPASYDVADTILIDLNLRPEDSQNAENTNFSLLSIRQGIQASTSAMREARALYLPTLTFNAGYRFSKTDAFRNINFFFPYYNQLNGYNYGLAVALPILNGFNTRRLNQQARIERDRQMLFYDQQKISLDVNLKNAYVTYDYAKKVLAIEEETIGLARENLYIALESFKRGLTTFIELRTAQQSLADAYNRLINARYLTKVAEVELLRLNGALLK